MSVLDRILPTEIIGEDGYWVKYNDDFENVMKLAESGEKMRWVPVSERLPEINNKCLLKTDFSYYVGYFDGELWQVNNEERSLSYPAVTHWMPLPDRPDEGNGE